MSVHKEIHIILVVVSTMVATWTVAQARTWTATVVINWTWPFLPFMVGAQIECCMRTWKETKTMWKVGVTFLRVLGQVFIGFLTNLFMLAAINDFVVL